MTSPKLLFAGLLTLLAGVISESDKGWVVALVGGMMVGLALYQDQMALSAIKAGREAQTPRHRANVSER